MGSLSEEIRREAATKKGPVCGVERVVNALGDDDAADLLMALDDDDITSAAIARALSGRGHAIKAYTLRRHQLGECSCEPA